MVIVGGDRCAIGDRAQKFFSSELCGIQPRSAIRRCEVPMCIERQALRSIP